MVGKRGKPIGYRTRNECNSWLGRHMGRDFANAWKEKTIANDRTLESHVEGTSGE
jgi:hypothetical protein